MKRVILIFCLTLFIFNVSAQKKGDIKFGIFTGANYAMPFGDDMEDLKEELEDQIEDVEQNGDASGGVYGKLGFHLGFGMDYYIKDNLAISSNLSYSEKGFSTRLETETENDQYVDFYPNPPSIGPVTSEIITLSQSTKAEMDVYLDYLDLPIGVKFQTDNGVTIFGGLLFSFLIIALP